MQHIGSIRQKAAGTTARDASLKKRIARLKTQLLDLAELRGATQPSDGALEAMASAISGFEEDVTIEAVRQLAEAPRAEFEPRMPTLAQLTETCRNIASSAKARKTRWCGRCFEGVLTGKGGDTHLCECCCELCNNSGWQVITNAGEPWDSRFHGREMRRARRCPKGCAIWGRELTA